MTFKEVKHKTGNKAIPHNLCRPTFRTLSCSWGFGWQLTVSKTRFGEADRITPHRKRNAKHLACVTF